MKIKIKDNEYESIKIPQYNRLRNMLEVLFCSNPKRFHFHGIIKNGKRGLLVCGEDKKGVREFQKFYPITDIHFYFNKHVKHLREDGERRLIDI